jgi:hypothetical protein
MEQTQQSSSQLERTMGSMSPDNLAEQLVQWGTSWILQTLSILSATFVMSHVPLAKIMVTSASRVTDL